MAERRADERAGGLPVFSPGVIPALRAVMDRGVSPDVVVALLEAAIDVREAGAVGSDIGWLVTSVLDTLQRVPAGELTTRLGGMIEKLAVEVERCES